MNDLTTREPRLEQTPLFKRIIRASREGKNAGSVRKTAELLGFNKKCIYHWIKIGYIPDRRGAHKRIIAAGFNPKTLKRLV